MILIEKSLKFFKFGMLPSCCILLTVFKTVFVFALGPIVASGVSLKRTIQI